MSVIFQKELKTDSVIFSMLEIAIYTLLNFNTYAHQMLVIDFMMEKISQKKFNLTRNFLFTR